MVSYAECKKLDLTRSRTEVYDVLSDIQRDIYGMNITLAAIAEQPYPVEPEQLNTLSTVTWIMSSALVAVLEHMDGELGKGQEVTPAAESDGEAGR